MLEKDKDLGESFSKALWKDGFVYDGVVVLIGYDAKPRVDLLKHKFLCLMEEMAEDERRFIEFLSLLKK